MIINIKIGESACGILVERDCFTPIIYGINKKEGSANFGKPTEDRLGYFAGVNSFAYAVNKLIQATLADDTDKVTLQEFARRVEVATASVLEQLQDWNKLKKLV